jgi:glycosyltransferase involved in cell wall biosynthesis
VRQFGFMVDGAETPASAAPLAEPRICLCMIARNEHRIIERCLDAAAPLVEAISVCDTGSDDGTPDIVTRWLETHHVAGRVSRHRWRDFGENRTRSIHAAQDLLRALGWDLERTYLLFLDADMVLRVDAEFRRTQLTADVYRVVQRNGHLVYPNVRLARARLEARFVGATHEYFSAAGVTEETLTTLSIDDRDDGGYKADKLERDVRLLTAQLARDPGDARAMFYLAQSYRALGDFPRALAWYRRRIAAGGWAEEVWYAHYAIGLMYLATDDIPGAARALHAAIRLDPGRAEPYAALAETFRTRRRHLRATFYGLRGLNRCGQGPPPERALFVESDAPLRLLRELSIAAYYTPHREAGFDANDRLALGADTPREVVTLAVNNQAFYAEPLPAVSHAPITPALPAPFVPCNPSIVRTTRGYLVNCRSVSYRMDAYQRYTALEADGIYRTRNFLLELDRDLRFVRQDEVRCDAPPLREHWVQGLEDCRLVHLGERLALTCTTTDRHPSGMIQLSLMVLDDQARVVHEAPLAGHGDDRVQKNWLPFTDGERGALYAVYGYEPLVVVRIDPETGRCVPVVERPQGRHFEDWRGSAGPLELPRERGGGRLLLIHEVAYQGRRYYLHRFVLADAEWRIVRVSRPFYFRHRGIEFAGGACLSHDGADVLITFGVEDCEAWLCRIPLRRVLDLLRPL